MTFFYLQTCHVEAIVQYLVQPAPSLGGVDGVMETVPGLLENV